MVGCGLWRAVTVCDTKHRGMGPHRRGRRRGLESAMRLNTYQSSHRPHLFVTLSTVEAQSVIAVVEALSMLALRVVRSDYAVPEDIRDTRFRELVFAGIAKDGYAIHGFEHAV